MYDIAPSQTPAPPHPVAREAPATTGSWIPKGARRAAGAPTSPRHSDPSPGCGGALTHPLNPEGGPTDWYAELEQGKKWLESQFAAYRELAESRERSIQELKEWNATLQTVNAEASAEVQRQKHRADMLASDVVRFTNELSQARAGVSWLEQQAANWKARADELHASLNTTGETRAWLESQRAAWEATARKHETEIARLLAWIQELEAAKAWLVGDRDQWKAAAQ